MPIRDSWHKTLVYFGLADEPDDYDYDDRAAPSPRSVLEDRYRERPNVRRLQPAAAGATTSTTSSPTRTRSARCARVRSRCARSRVDASASAAAARGNEFGVHLVIPKSFNDAQQVADKFKDGSP